MALSGVSSQNPGANPPPPVRAGDRVGVAALSGPVDGERLDAGLRALAELGFEPVEAANLRRREGLFAGTDAERLGAFHELAADPTVRAIFFARGGHGLLRLMPSIDWHLLARQPRAYIGYSDLTPLLLQIVERLGLVSFHGPMVAADLARGLHPEEATSLRRALAGETPIRIAVRPLAAGPDGVVEGRLLGGCLSLLAALQGTRFAPDLSGSLLFIEEIDEPLYRFDRMLTHLELSGSLTALRGLIAGHLTNVRDFRGADAEDEEEGPRTTALQRLADLANRFDWPVAAGLAVGHERPNLTLPLGAKARFDPAAGQLTIDL